MQKKLTALLFCVCLLAAVFAGCGARNDISSGAGAQDYPVTIGKVTFSARPEGAAVLSPSLADVVLALGYEISLKARSADCSQSDLSVLPTVTADDAEKMKNLGVQLVLTDSDLPQAQSAAMEQQGITVLKLAPATGREDLDRLYSQVGAALRGAKTGYEHGLKISQSIFLTIDDISRVVPNQDVPVPVVYLYDAKGGAATGDTLAGRLIDAAGLVNAAGGATGGKLGITELRRADPGYIFCPAGVKAALQASAEYQDLTAVKKGRVYEMDPNLMTRQGRGLVDAAGFMVGTVYPELLGGKQPSSPASSGASSAPASSSSSSAPSESSSAPADGTLRKGMQGSEVLKMQNRLEELGYMFMKPSGLYGDGTEQAVKDFQLLNGMAATGVADPATQQKIYSAGAKKRSG